MSTERQRMEHLVDTFQTVFGARRQDIRLIRAPLRICPLGAHVDHQLGAVTGMTVDEPILLAYTPAPDGMVRIHSLNFTPPVTFALDDVPAKGEPMWANYARGAVMALQQRYMLHTGINGIIAGTLPIGGLSSSAAVGVAYLLALEDVNVLQVSPLENVALDRFIENEYIGLQNGVMDQSMILLSERGHLTHLDCQTLEFNRYPAPLTEDEYDVLVVYSGLTRSLVNTDYNQRVAQCEAAAAWLLERAGSAVPPRPRLRQVPEAVYETYGADLPHPLDKRARHFFGEMERVRQGVAAWQAGALDRFGALMAASGESSIVNYECGSPHLIALYEILNACSGVYGARFSGAGFRGCCIALSDPRQRATILETIAREYPARHPEVAEAYGVFFCKPDVGASRVDLS